MKDFHKYFIIPTEPDILYKALTYAPTIQLWTGEEAQMSDEPNTEFSLWDGSIEGMNLAFEENKKIVQEWYFGEQEEKSIVTLKMFAKGANTSLEIQHTNIPDDAYQDVVEGWEHSYVASLLRFYADEH